MGINFCKIAQNSWNLRKLSLAKTTSFKVVSKRNNVGELIMKCKNCIFFSSWDFFSKLTTLSLRHFFLQNDYPTNPIFLWYYSCIRFMFLMKHFFSCWWSMSFCKGVSSALLLTTQTLWMGSKRSKNCFLRFYFQL